MAAKNLKQWLNESRENQIAYAEEDLILEVTEAIWDLLQTENITKAELADRLGKTKSFVSQALSGSRNMTLRTLADIAFVLEAKPRITLLKEKEDAQWVQIGNVVPWNQLTTTVAGQDEDWSEPTTLTTRLLVQATA